VVIKGTDTNAEDRPDGETQRRKAGRVEKRFEQFGGEVQEDDGNFAIARSGVKETRRQADRRTENSFGKTQYILFIKMTKLQVLHSE
jgi:hypothetical protein